MYALYILVVVAISLLATTSYSVFSLRKSMEIETQVQKNVLQMESATVFLKSLVRPAALGGPPRAPLGRSEADGRHVLPAAMSGRDRTPWGASYAYCPVAPFPLSPSESALSPKAATISGGDDYGVDVVDASPSGGYVVSSTFGATVPTFAGQDGPAPDDAVAYVLSPAPGAFAMPFCGDVAYRDGAFVIGGSDTDGDGKVDEPPRVGGTVAAVRTDSPLLRFGIAREEPVVYVAPMASGKGDGGSTSDPMSLPDALAWWNAAPMRNSTFSLAGGSYELASDLEIGSSEPGREIVLRGRTGGEAGAGLPMFSSSSPRYLILSSDTDVEGLSFDPQVGVRVVRAAKARFSSTRLGHLRVDGGHVVLDRGTSIVHGTGHPGRAVEMTSGRIDVVSPISVSDQTARDGIAAIVATGGTLAVSGADLEFAIGAGGFPWLLRGTAVLDVGVRSDGTPPVAKWNGTDGPIVGRVRTETSCTESEICVASCPALTYPVSGSCGAFDASGNPLPPSPSVEQNLVSSATAGNGWRCHWSKENVVGGASLADFVPRARRLPPISKAAAECSATVH